MTKLLDEIHPGEILLEDFMKPMGITARQLAADIDVSPSRISEIVHGTRPITADTALRLGIFFTMDPREIVVVVSRPCKIHRKIAKPKKPPSDRFADLVKSNTAKGVSKAANKAHSQLVRLSCSVLRTKKAVARPPRAMARSSQRML